MIAEADQSAGQALFEEIQARFPKEGLELLEVAPSPEDPRLTLVRISSPADEDREDEVLEFAAERATERLLAHDQYLVVVPSLVEVNVEFPHARGAKATYESLFVELNDFLRATSAGEAAGLSFGSHSGPRVILNVRSVDFARHDLVEHLRKLGVLEEAEVYLELSSLSREHPQGQKRLYPSEE